MADERIEIRRAEGESDFQEAKELIVEYVAWLGIDMSFQNFDKEIESLPKMYNENDGGLFIARVKGRAVGIAGVRRYAEHDCEVKRMFVKPEARGLGIAKMLLAKCIENARDLHYQSAKLDTAGFMEAAIKLYTDYGFVEIDAYRYNPFDEAKYFALDLTGKASHS